MPTGIQEIDALHKDVTDLKVSVAGMKPYIEQIPGISESLKVLSEIMPKLQANMEDHHHIHKRLDEADKFSDRIDARLREIEIDHAACMERQRLEEVEEKESVWTLTKRAAIPVIVTAVLGFAGWMVMKHLPDYVISRSLSAPMVNEEVAK